MKESELSNIVSDWFKSRGYEIYTEVPYGKYSYKRIDIVAKNENVVIPVELKISLNEAVFYQSLINQNISPWCYSAVSKNPQKKSLRRHIEHGIGVMLIKDNKVSVLLEPSGKDVKLNYSRTELLGRLENMEQGGIAGMPNQKGVGPAQTVGKAVREYLLLNPSASWKELYANVNNHYSCPSSMCTALKFRCNFSMTEHRKNTH